MTSNSGWLVNARFGQDTQDAAAVNRTVLDGLENGVSALTLSVGGKNLPVAELEAALAGVLLDLAPLTLDARRGRRRRRAAALLAARRARRCR